MTRKLTNLANLPEPIVEAVAFDDRDRGDCDYTITELLRPGWMAKLEREHADQITEDAADRIWAMLGQAVHDLLRRSARGNYVERRLFASLDQWALSGQLDYADVATEDDDRTLSDYKLVSIYAIKDGAKPEWIEQLNCYRWLAAYNAIDFNQLQIAAFLRDWRRREAERDPDYPQRQVAIFDIPVWNLTDTANFLRQRIYEHCEGTPCTSADVWERPQKWAVMLPNRKRAIKLHATANEAYSHAGHLSSQAFVEARPAERPRCESYCKVAPFCSIYAEWKKEQYDQHSPF